MHERGNLEDSILACDRLFPIGCRWLVRAGVHACSEAACSRLRVSYGPSVYASSLACFSQVAPPSRLASRLTSRLAIFLFDAPLYSQFSLMLFGLFFVTPTVRHTLLYLFSCLFPYALLFLRVACC